VRSLHGELTHFEENSVGAAAISVSPITWRVDHQGRCQGLCDLPA
jgi:hypothetical protein